VAPHLEFRKLMTTAQTLTDAELTMSNTNYVCLDKEDHCQEYCQVSAAIMQALSLQVGDQLRIYSVDDPNDFALFTIKDGFLSTTPGVKLASKGFLRIGVPDTMDPADVAVIVWRQAAVGGHNIKTLTAVQDKATLANRNDFYEFSMDSQDSRSVIFLAPHGGEIETYTDNQAELAYKRVISKGRPATLWTCSGYTGADKDGNEQCCLAPKLDPDFWGLPDDSNVCGHKGEGAACRWHITASDLSFRSFKRLGRIVDRLDASAPYYTGKRFKYAVAFHGTHREAGNPLIRIGGNANQDLRTAVRTAIANSGVATEDQIFIVDIKGDQFGGQNPANIVNRMAPGGLNFGGAGAVHHGGGIQIEQTPEMKFIDKDTGKGNGRLIAEAVADLLLTWI
jgi:phage replication-related protein YjqB (UPF0714/DUF867 family)